MSNPNARIYATNDVAHAADMETPLHHGVIRYVPSDNLSANIRNTLPAKNDRPYVYVPVGYCHRHSDFVEKILMALNLSVPNMVVVTAETSGSMEEQLDAYRVQNAASHQLAKDWTEQHIREVLAAKVGRLLEGVMESSGGVGAWILPNSPRRRNAAAQMVCEAFPSKVAQVALGLIGLGEDEEDVLFKQSLDESKAPVGSPIRNVSQLVYDVDLMDGAPCASLTHLLVFESPEERNVFRELFLDLVPDYLVAFGNLTEDAMKGVFENAKAGSPVILLKHTGVATDSLCKMFEHVNQHIMESDDTKKHIPPIEVEGQHGDLVKLFLNTWPSSYNSKSIVLADPLIMNAASLQKRILSAITAAFDLKSGDVAMRLAKRKVLDYAWSLHDICNGHSKQKKKSAESLHKQLVLCTLISIIASVLYEKVYGGGTEHVKTLVQNCTYVATIILPLYITSLKQESNEGLAMVRWAAFKIAATRIESEILKFRCQVGPYRVQEKTEIALIRPMQVFAKKIKFILSSVSKSNLVEDALAISPNFWEFDVQAHIPPPKSTTDDGSKMSSRAHVPTTIRLVENGGMACDSKTIEEATPFLEMTDKYGSTNGGHDEEMPIINGSNENNDDASTDSSVKFVDDKYSPLKTDDYIELRMQVKMLKKAEKIEKMAKRNKSLNSTVKIITIGSGAAAALSLQWAVPIVLGITASLGSALSFRTYPRRIEFGNAMVMQLNELKLWWMSLSMYQKQLPHNKDNLVLSAEKIIMKEMELSFASSGGDDEDE